MDEAIFKWFNMARDKNVPIKGPHNREKVLYFTKSLGHKDFMASVSWLDKFKKGTVLFKK